MGTAPVFWLLTTFVVELNARPFLGLGIVQINLTLLSAFENVPCGSASPCLAILPVICRYCLFLVFKFNLLLLCSYLLDS